MAVGALVAAFFTSLASPIPGDEIIMGIAVLGWLGYESWKVSQAGNSEQYSVNVGGVQPLINTHEIETIPVAITDVEIQLPAQNRYLGSGYIGEVLSNYLAPNYTPILESYQDRTKVNLVTLNEANVMMMNSIGFENLVLPTVTADIGYNIMMSNACIPSGCMNVGDNLPSDPFATSRLYNTLVLAAATWLTAKPTITMLKEGED